VAERFREILGDRVSVEMTGLSVLFGRTFSVVNVTMARSYVTALLIITPLMVLLIGSLKRGVLSMVPNLIPIWITLGLMGWLGIPLDLMTFTIAAFSIGIGVDDTIHYVHRMKAERSDDDDDDWDAVDRSHASVGRAMYYTTIAIALGFSILALSNFVPTVYFGLLTGLAMITALIADLTLLPLLIVRFKPFDRSSRTAALGVE
jgi:predicted RND superfamily exporter protein